MSRQLIPIVDCFKQKNRQQNMDRGTERNEARGEEAGRRLHGELFISSTFTYSDPVSGLYL